MKKDKRESAKKDPERSRNLRNFEKADNGVSMESHSAFLLFLSGGLKNKNIICRPQRPGESL